MKLFLVGTMNESFVQFIQQYVLMGRRQSCAMFSAPGLKVERSKDKAWGPFLESPDNFMGP